MFLFSISIILYTRGTAIEDEGEIRSTLIYTVGPTDILENALLILCHQGDFSKQSLEKKFFLVVKSNSIRGFVRPSVGRSVGWSVGPSVGPSVRRFTKTANSSKFK